MNMIRTIGQSMKMVKNFTRWYSSFGCGPVMPNISCLSNGMRVVTDETASPLPCVALFVEAGPVYENPTNHGITHFIEHMAYRGFKSMEKQKLDDFLTCIGAKMSVLTTREFQVFYAQCFVENVPDTVCLLSKIVTELELTDAEMEMAKCAIDLQSLDVDNDPKAVVFDYLHESAFQCTPLGRRALGPSRNLKKFDRNTVECYMKEFYHPVRFVLATSGAVSHNSMVANAETCFGRMESPTCSPDYWPQQRFTGSQIVYRDDSMSLVHAAIAVEAPGMRNFDSYLKMYLASNIIGSWSQTQGGNNRHGWPLARAAATSNLCDSFESFYIPYRNVGLWGIYIVAEKMSVEDMISNAQDRWMHLCTTTTANDVERGINATKLELARRIEGSVKSCYDIGVQVLYNCEQKSLSSMYESLSRVNATVVKEIANRYIYDVCPVVAALGPTEALPEYTRTRAGMYWLRL